MLQRVFPIRKQMSLVLPISLSVFFTGGRVLSAADPPTTTPIKHVVIIFQENVSFDHYFGTYPKATNPAGEPAFHAKRGTPSVNGLSGPLLTANPNLSNPVRLDRVLSQLVTCDQDHNYADEQKAFDHGLMDKFVQTLAGSSCADKSIVMDYYDGNTVTALWNYAQHFAMSDNSFSTTFGPSTPGALNLIAGQTSGATLTHGSATNNISNGTVIGDPRPTTDYDDCAAPFNNRIKMTGTNVGDLLNTAGVTWGWFQGGFKPSNGAALPAVCATSHANIAGAHVTDYIPHHEPFQYFLSTSNPHHLPPTSVAMIGKTDQANHQYDLSDFFAALSAGNLPAVTYLKAGGYQDGHAGYSDPLDEQTFLVNTINTLMKSPFWKDMAIFVLYDDSDGWYDHVMGPIVNQSSDPTYDFLTDLGACGNGAASPLPDRCGYGPRQPFLTISPYARKNFVASNVTDQSSTLKFIEDNFSLGGIGDHSTDAIAGSLLPMFNFSQEAEDDSGLLILDPSTGQPVSDDESNDN